MNHGYDTFGIREVWAVLMAVVLVADWAALRYTRRAAPPL
jgi:hypothetical protein